MNNEQRIIVSRLQNNLYTIRQLAGWSADELGNLLDVTRQTVYNLERGNPKMSWVQYLAIRKIIDIEIERQPDNKVLVQAVTVLLDNEELEISEAEMEELQVSLRTIAKGMTRTADRSIALKLALQTVGAATAGIAASVLSRSAGTGISTGLMIARTLAGKK